MVVIRQPMVRFSDRWHHWAGLFLGSVVVIAIMDWLHISGALFLGPLVAGLAFGFGGSPIRISHTGTAISQCLIGCVLARALDWDLIDFTLRNAWAIFVVVFTTTAAAVGIAYVLYRVTDIDRDTTAWGSIPGAGAIMVAFAAEFGGDPRLVAFMQFARAILVISTVSAVLSLIGGNPRVLASAATATHTALASDYVQTLLIALGGFLLNRVIRLPGGALLIPAAIGAILHIEGFVTLDLPWIVQAFAVGLLGAYVGLQFDRIVLATALRNLPAIFGAILVLMLVCGALGLTLAWQLGIDPLTGYLATSPGGIDSIAVLGLSSSADMSIVMAVQTIRFFAVILLAPWLAALIRRQLFFFLRAGD